MLCEEETEQPQIFIGESAENLLSGIPDAQFEESRSSLVTRGYFFANRTSPMTIKAPPMRQPPICQVPNWKGFSPVRKISADAKMIRIMTPTKRLTAPIILLVFIGPFSFSC